MKKSINKINNNSSYLNSVLDLGFREIWTTNYDTVIEDNLKKADSKDMAAMLSFAEVYNGLGYFNKGVVSPYIYSGTNLYKKGKFVSDGSYNASVTDKQPGVYILIKKII